MQTTLKTEICVVGGGSGGYASALRAAQAGCKTILVEKEPLLGGNSTACGVNCWEPVTGAENDPAGRIRETGPSAGGNAGPSERHRHHAAADGAGYQSNVKIPLKRGLSTEKRSSPAGLPGCFQIIFPWL